MKEATIKQIVSRTLSPYSNRPKVQYEADGYLIVNLIEGNYEARDAVEKALKKHTTQIQNRPTGKRIWVNVAVY